MLEDELEELDPELADVVGARAPVIRCTAPSGSVSVKSGRRRRAVAHLGRAALHREVRGAGVEREVHPRAARERLRRLARRGGGLEEALQGVEARARSSSGQCYDRTGARAETPARGIPRGTAALDRSARPGHSPAHDDPSRDPARALRRHGPLRRGCSPKRIPGTEIEDTGDNRAVYEVVRAYQKALEGRDAAAILALVSPDYFDAAGTPDPGRRPRPRPARAEPPGRTSPSSRESGST